MLNNMDGSLRLGDGACSRLGIQQGTTLIYKHNDNGTYKLYNCINGNEVGECKITDIEELRWF